MLILEPEPGSEPRMDRLLLSAQVRAEAAGWHCWTYRNELHPEEITVFIEGPGDWGPGRPVFGEEISELKALARRFEPVRSLIEYLPEGGES